MNKTLLLFDCFGVIYHTASESYFVSHFGEDASRLHKELFDGADEGRIPLTEVAANIERRFGYSGDEFIESCKKNAYLIPDTAELITRLSKVADLCLVSNITEVMVKHIEAGFDFPKYFKKNYYSCRLGVAKPNKDVFRKVLADLNETYDHIYFIDDNIKNVTGLEDLGIEGILFLGAEELEKTLISKGLEIPTK